MIFSSANSVSDLGKISIKYRRQFLVRWIRHVPFWLMLIPHCHPLPLTTWMARPILDSQRLIESSSFRAKRVLLFSVFAHVLLTTSIMLSSAWTVLKDFLRLSYRSLDEINGALAFFGLNRNWFVVRAVKSSVSLFSALRGLSIKVWSSTSVELWTQKRELHHLPSKPRKQP